LTSFPRSLALLLAFLLAACTSTPTPTASVPPAPTSAASPSPTSAASPSGLPTDGPSTSPTTTPTPTPTSTPSATPTPTATPVSGSLASQFSAPLAEVLDLQRTSLVVPGMSAAIIFPDGSMWSGESGLAEISPARNVSTDTPFVAGSITKTFIAATIMQLVDEGQLSLDDPLSNWLADFPRADQIRLRMLLSHTSGVFNLYEDSDYYRLVVERPHRTWMPQDVLDRLVEAPYCDPGTCYHYSNTGFILLGLVIEAQTGRPLGTVFRERFLTPLGLNATYFQGDGPPPASSARGYKASGGGNIAIDDGSAYRPTESEGTVIWAAGGIVASAPDLARWGQTLYGGDVISADSLAQMTDFVLRPQPQGGYYGLGTRMRMFDGIAMEGHTGTLRAFNAAMWYLPSLDLTVVVMTNRTGIDANAIVDAFLAVAVPAVD